MQAHLSKQPIVQGQKPQATQFHPCPLFSSRSALSLHLRVPNYYPSNLPHSVTSTLTHILIIFPFFTPPPTPVFIICFISPYLCLLPSPPQNRQKKPLLPAYESTDRFMWSVWFCSVSYMFRHVKELYPRMELHPQIPSALTFFQRLC